MATHISCHVSDIVPNSFPPPRPTSRDHGMLSEYEAGIVMHQTFPFQTAAVEGGIGFLSDGDELPVLRKSMPSAATTSAEDFGYFYDPELCVTPEKPGARQKVKAPLLTQSLKRGSDEGILSDRPQNSSKVRFDTVVEVKQMSPETWSMETSNTEESLPMPSSISTASNESNEPVAARKNLLTNKEYQSSVKSGPQVQAYSSEKYSDSSVDSSQQLPTLGQDRDYTQYNTSSLPSRLNSSEELDSDSFRTASTNSSHLSSTFGSCDLEPISVVASDLQTSRPSINKSSKSKSRHKRIPESSEMGRPITVIGGGVTEHTLARPEFNSTLRVSKEIRDLQETDLDVVAAVEQKLKVSGKVKTQIDEKAYSKLNARELAQFPDLVSVEVSEVDILSRAAREKTAKVKPQVATKAFKPEDAIVHPPDIMDFFTPDLQQESASYSLDGIPPYDDGPHTADLHRAFDVYRHIRSWEGW